MALSHEVVSQFAKLVDNKPKKDEGVTVKGTYKIIGDIEYVQLDGSDVLTPVESTVEAKTGERVQVLIKDHFATVTGNISSPAARSKDVKDLADTVDEQGNTIQQMDNTIIQQGNSIIQMNTSINQHETIINQHDTKINQQGDQIVSINNTVISQGNSIEANHNAIIAQGNEIDVMNDTITSHGNSITSMNNTIQQHGNKIDQNSNTISQQGNTINQQGNKITEIDNTVKTQGNTIVAQGNTIDAHETKLTTHNSQITILNSGFVIKDGVLTGLSKIILNDLETNTLKAGYAKIDFSNIGIAAIEKLFTDSGIIKDLIVDKGHITGELVGVTIKGDLIEGNTIKADKLVIKGSDGLYYKLNTNGETVESEQTTENSLDGSIITAKSITASKIQVTDLVAFGATIGGFDITNDSIHTHLKDSINSNSNGLFFGKDGQIYIGDNNNKLKYYKDDNGKWRFEISADSIKINTHSKTITEELEEIREEVTTFLQIESSKGTVFKNDQVDTLLSITIYRGSDRITDIKTLREKMGNNVYLQWKWKRLNDDDYGIISADDPRIGQNGFTFTLSPQDVDTKVTFLCELIS